MIQEIICFILMWSDLHGNMWLLLTSLI